MFNTRILIFVFTLAMASMATAQVRSISSIVGESSISPADESKIQKYAGYWAQQLLADDAELLEQAHTKLATPFDSDVRMTTYARMLYGKYLKEAFASLLDRTNENEVAAVNALQILSLLGTEQAVLELIDHSDSSTESRSALRLWASVGLGTSFLTGELPVNRVDRYAKLLSNFTNKETQWFVLSRQFDSLAALQGIPKLDRNDRDVFEALSFELQTKSLVRLLTSINNSVGTDQRVQALPFILPSLLLQLIEPSVDEQVKSETFDAILPELISFVDYAASNNSIEGGTFLHGAYGRAVHSASMLITRAIGEGGDVKVIDLWNSGDYTTILELVEIWKTSQ